MDEGLQAYQDRRFIRKLKPKNCPNCNISFYPRPKSQTYCSIPCWKEYMLKTAENRFQSRIDKTIGYGRNGDCWQWTGGHDAKGYGMLTSSFNGESRAHRAMYKRINGIIPYSLQVLHHCDNPPCVNPEHLFLGTNRDNVDDKVAKGRAKGYSSPGIKHPMAKLTDNEVKEIRNLHIKGIYSQRKIGEFYGVSGSTIGLIVARKIWTHI